MTDSQKERRDTLSVADIAALAEHHGLVLAAGSPLVDGSVRDLPHQENERTGRASLESRGLLGADWREALAVLAAPTLQVRALIPGPDAAFIPILYGTHEQGWVGCWRDGLGLLVTFPWDADRILAMGYQVLMATEPPPPDGLSLSLSLPGLTALACVVDALRAFLFRSLLNRLTFTSPVLTRAELAGHLEQGLLNADSRWLVSLLDVVGSPHFPLAPQELPAGIEELERMGMLIPTEEGWEPVLSLQRLALMWRSVLPAFALESIVVGDDGALRQYGHRVVIRGDGPLWQIDYGAELWGGAPRVTLRDLSPLECFNGLQTLLASPLAGPQKAQPAAGKAIVAAHPPVEGLAAAKPTCPHCGRPVTQGARFCRNCGQPLA
jgi:hypothetical protein